MLPAANSKGVVSPLASPLLGDLPWRAPPQHYGLIYAGADGFVVLRVTYALEPNSLALMAGSFRCVEIIRYPAGFVLEDENHPHVISDALQIQALLMEWHDKGLVEVVT